MYSPDELANLAREAWEDMRDDDFESEVPAGEKSVFSQMLDEYGPWVLPGFVFDDSIPF